jgi:hypothetical protein
MKIKKRLLQLVMTLGLGFVLLPYIGSIAYAQPITKDNVTVDVKQIKTLASPNWQIIQINDSRNGVISQSLAATVASVVNASTQNNGWLYAVDMLRWLYPKDTIEQLKNENISAEQAVAWLNSIGYTASIVNRPLTTSEIKTSLDKNNPIITIFESQDSANWLEKETAGVLYAHDDVEAGSQKLHQSFIKTAYHDELFVTDGMEGNSFKLPDQSENPNTTIANTDFKWVKSITDIQKDPSWDSRANIVGNRAAGVFNVDLTKSGNDITKASFTDKDVEALRGKYPETTTSSETKLAAVDLINLYFDGAHQKTIGDLETFSKVTATQDVTANQVVEWYKSLGFVCDVAKGKLTKSLTKSISSAGKLYLTTYQAQDKKNPIRQLASIGLGFTDNNFGYLPDLATVKEWEYISTAYTINWYAQNAYQKYLERNKAYDYDNFLRMDDKNAVNQGEYQSDTTIYNIRQKSSPETNNPQFTPTVSKVTAPEQIAKYSTNTNFEVREQQGQEPWCAAYVDAAAINTFKKATDTSIITAKMIKQAEYPNLSDEELSKKGGGTVENAVKLLKSKYNIGVTVESRALSFDEVKKEIDAGQIIEMDAYNVNAQTSEEKYETSHALAIVGYVTPSNGDKNKTPYYEIWNPWWRDTFYIPANAPTFRVGGIDYKWERTWHNWRQNGPVSVDAASAKQTVASMGNPAAVKQNLMPTNPLLSGRTAFSNLKSNQLQSLSLSDEILFPNIDLPRSQDVMGQLVSSFGSETTIESKTHGSTFGYAFSLGGAEFMRARRNKATKTTTNMLKAKAFSDSVDDIISARGAIKLFGIGTAVFMAVYIALQIIPVANWVSNIALGIINFVTGGGLGIDTLALGKSIADYYTASQRAETAFNKI